MSSRERVPAAPVSWAATGSGSNARIGRVMRRIRKTRVS
ncbi:hypothetical protein [Alloyangia pacifica]